MKRYWPILLMAWAVAARAQGTVTITTSQLPLGQLNLPYSFQLTATGGTPPYTWSLGAGQNRVFSIRPSLSTGGGLNPGLTLSPSGLISGTPTGSGGIFSVQATDSASPPSTPGFATFSIPLCSGSLNLSSQGHTFEDPGGSAALSVTSSCGALTASTSVPWISVTGNNGVDTINIAVAPNSTPAARTGNVIFTYNSVSPVLVLSYTITQYAKLIFATPSPLPLGVVGVPYSLALQASGGSAIGRSFAITSGSLPAGLSLSSQTIGGTPTLPGTYAFTATVTDHDGFSGTPFSGLQAYSMTVVPPVSVITTVLPGALAGLPYSASVAASGGVPPYTWSLASGTLPSGLFLNPATGVIAGTPAAASQGTYTISIRASDSVGLTGTASFQLLVDPPPLVIQNSHLTPATEGVPYSAVVTANGGSPPYTWSASGLPSWLTLSSTGQLSGTPPLGSAGTYSFTIDVQDAAFRFAGMSFTLQVNSGLPRITTASPLPPAKEGSPVSASFQASGGVAPYSWTAVGLPSFLNLSTSGMLSGVPPAGSAGTYSFSVSMVDASGNRASGNFSLSIDPALSIATSSSLQTTEGQALSATFTASGGTGPYTFSANGLPGWASISAAGVLSGTPLRGSAGGSAIQISVADAAGHSASAPFTLTVLAANGGLTVTTPTSLPNAAIGSYYQATLNAAGGAAPYRWSGSGLPAGLTLSSSGVLSGVPTSSGDPIITAQVTDASGNVAFQALNINVTPMALRIVTPSPLAAAEVTAPYSVAFQSDGGDRPLTWSVSGPLPAGMTFSSTGLLSGTPTAPGDSVFTVQVTDASGMSASAAYEVLTRPFGPDLLVSAGSLSFTGVLGANAPPVQTVSVISTTHDSIPFVASVDSPWIIAVASGMTPGRIDVNIDPTGLAPGNYSGSITVTSPNRAAVSIKVGLTVNVAAAVLQASPQAIDLFSDGTSASPGQNIYVHNNSQSSLTFTVSTDVPWLSVNPASGAVSPNSSTVVTAGFASTQALAPGAYVGNIEIDSANGTARIPVSLLISAMPNLILSNTGVYFRARQGNGVAGPPAQSFAVTSSSSTPMTFQTQQIGGDGWLSIATPSGQVSNGSPATVFFSVSTAGLNTGAYYALIRVTSPDAFNSPQDFVVVLDIVEAASAPVPNPFPSGLVFTAPGNQTVSVYSSTDQNAPYQVAISTQNGTGWLSASPTTGTLSTSAPAQLAISANPGNLKPGIYTGSVHISISNLAVRTINVTFIVPASSSGASAAAGLADTPQGSCSPANLVVTPTSLTGNFSTPAAWPRSVAVQLSDDCGNSIANGQAVAEFSNGDPPLSLNLSDSRSGVYSATWTPSHAASQLTVTAEATASGLPPATAQIVGGVTENAAPILARNGTLHNFFPQPGAPLAPGTIVQIFGSALASNSSSTTLPLPNILNGTSVLIGGELAPLYFVSSGQINAQLPVDLLPGQQYQVLVVANNAFTTPDTILIAPATPGIARLSNGQVIAQHSDFSLVTEDAPAKAGEFLVVYLAGMGLTDTPVATGAQAPSSPLAAVNAAATVAVDGESARVLFAGLTPGFIGLYQINFQVPADARSGDRKLEIFQSGLSANTSVLPVQ